MSDNENAAYSVRVRTSGKTSQIIEVQLFPQQTVADLTASFIRAHSESGAEKNTTGINDDQVEWRFICAGKYLEPADMVVHGKSFLPPNCLIHAIQKKKVPQPTATPAAPTSGGTGGAATEQLNAGNLQDPVSLQQVMRLTDSEGNRARQDPVIVREEEWVEVWPPVPRSSAVRANPFSQLDTPAVVSISSNPPPAAQLRQRRMANMTTVNPTPDQIPDTDALIQAIPSDARNFIPNPSTMMNSLTLSSTAAAVLGVLMGFLLGISALLALAPKSPVPVSLRIFLCLGTLLNWVVAFQGGVSIDDPIYAHG